MSSASPSSPAAALSLPPRPRRFQTPTKGQIIETVLWTFIGCLVAFGLVSGVGEVFHQVDLKDERNPIAFGKVDHVEILPSQDGDTRATIFLKDGRSYPILSYNRDPWVTPQKDARVIILENGQGECWFKVRP